VKSISRIRDTFWFLNFFVNYRPTSWGGDVGRNPTGPKTGRTRAGLDPESKK
jgi:hypothetical protein